MRQCGVLLPLFSLPSPYGIGTLGKAAYDFLDFLSEAGQRIWQLLPLGPTGYGDSPYQPFSAFAGNPYFIDLDDLAQRGLLTADEMRGFDFGADPSHISYGALYRERPKALCLAHSRFAGGSDFERFCEENAYWLDAFALFMAIKRQAGDRSFTSWEPGLRAARRDDVARAKRHLADEMAFVRFCQYLFWDQFWALRAYARTKGVLLMGDLPIYVAMDSADVWARRSLFRVDAAGRPDAIAGCPPDGFSREGQVWGNPLYDWRALRAEGYGWWEQRLRQAFAAFDLVRIDHFRGFESYFAIPADTERAVDGVWEAGPGMDFIRAMQGAFGSLPLVAEDLGHLTDSFRAFLKKTGFPGMKVLQFAFSGNPANEYLPHRHSPHSFVYTGTHDNDTLAGWLTHAPGHERNLAVRYLGLNGEEGFAPGLLRAALSSVANVAILPLQDYLELGSEARFNRPAQALGNWTFRIEERHLTHALAHTMKGYAMRYGRLTAGGVDGNHLF